MGVEEGERGGRGTISNRLIDSNFNYAKKLGFFFQLIISLVVSNVQLWGRGGKEEEEEMEEEEESVSVRASIRRFPKHFSSPPSLLDSE